LAARGEHDCRHVGPGARLAQHLEAVDAGHDQIEHDHLRLEGRDADERVCPILGQRDVVAVTAQRGAQRPPDLRLVIDHQDALTRHSACPPSAGS
jgi:hypothetical protein